MRDLILYLLVHLAGWFLCAYVFIPRFRSGFHRGLITALNGLDKLLNTKKAPPAKLGVVNGKRKKRNAKTQ